MPPVKLCPRGHAITGDNRVLVSQTQKGVSYTYERCRLCRNNPPSRIRRTKPRIPAVVRPLNEQLRLAVRDAFSRIGR